VLKCACNYPWKGNVNLKWLIFSRFARTAHRNSHTHCFQTFIQNICRGLLQYCLYKASVCLLYYLLVDQKKFTQNVFTTPTSEPNVDLCGFSICKNVSWHPLLPYTNFILFKFIYVKIVLQKNLTGMP